MSVQILAGVSAIPVMVGVKGSAETETSTEMGKTTETSTTDTISVDVFVPENSQISASIVTNKITSTVPYTAMLEKYFADGTRKREKIRSQYEGVVMNEVSVQYGEIESLLEGRGNDDLERKKRRAVNPRPKKPLKERL